jgi:hypothetical protein
MEYTQSGFNAAICERPGRVYAIREEGLKIVSSTEVPNGRTEDRLKGE